MTKLRLLETMSSKQTKRLFEYLRDQFLSRYVPDAIQNGFSRRETPNQLTRQCAFQAVVTVKTVTP